MFDPTLASKAKARREVESILRAALHNRSLQPYFHSLVRLDNPLDIVGFEALARIELPNGEILPPNEFIPVAESTGLIVEVGESILKQACIACTQWPDQMGVAVNVSPIQFLKSDFFSTVKDALVLSGLAAHRLELEITESVLINEIARIEPVLVKLRKIGVRIALDDFGDGFCGLHYLRRVTIDKIKIDKSIIDDVSEGQVARNILRSVWQIANEIGATVTVEGIDTLAKAEFLTRENCAHELQGYLFSRPVPAQETLRMLEFMNPGQADAKIVALADYSREPLAG